MINWVTRFRGGDTAVFLTVYDFFAQIVFAHRRSAQGPTGVQPAAQGTGRSKEATRHEAHPFIRPAPGQAGRRGLYAGGPGLYPGPDLGDRGRGGAGRPAHRRGRV